MTVCVAATCEVSPNGARGVIVAADRMVTLGNLIEFEHAVPKMAVPSPYAVARIAALQES